MECFMEDCDRTALVEGGCKHHIDEAVDRLARREFKNFESQYTAAANPHLSAEEVYVAGFRRGRGLR